MSLKAKGLLSVMLSLPSNWDYSIEGLVAICKENETSVKSTLSELKSFGYLKVTKLLPNQTKSGRLEYVYDIFEKPNQEVEKQGLENLGVEFQAVENQGQLNIDNKIPYNKELNIKENSNNITIKETQKRFVKPTLEEVNQYIEECDYHFSAEAFIGQKNKKNWRSACRTWELKWRESHPYFNPSKAVKEKEIDANINLNDLLGEEI